MCLKIQVLGNGSLSTVSICIEKVSGKRFALKAGGVASVDLDFRKVQLVQFLPFWGIEGKQRHWLDIEQRWELARVFLRFIK